MLRTYKFIRLFIFVFVCLVLPACFEAPPGGSSEGNSSSSSTTKSATLVLLSSELQRGAFADIDSDSDSYTFPDTAIETSNKIIFTLSNTGDLPAKITSAPQLDLPFSYASGSYPGNGGTCKRTITPKEECTIAVSFNPTSMGNAQVTYKLIYNNGKLSRTLEKTFIGKGYSTPTLDSVYPHIGAISGGNTITLSGSQLYPGATVKLDGKTCDVTASTTSIITCATPAHALGPVDIVVRNTDGKSTSLVGNFSYVAAPTVTSCSLDAGALAGGTTVTLTGSGFYAGATVTIGGVSCSSPTVNSLTSLSCVTGAHSAGVTSAIVTNVDGQSGTGSNLYTYQPAPTVSSVALTAGALAGGTLITITGTGFISGATATVGGVTCTTPNVSSSTTMTCTTGAHAAAVTSIIVTNSDTQSGTGTNLYTYQPAPTVTGISPSSGFSSGLTAVTLTGTGFLSGATVSIGGSTCNTPVVVSATSITCTTSAHAGATSDVVVTNSDLQAGTLASGYTYVPPPTISSLGTTVGSTDGFTTVLVNGTGFLSGVTVLFGGIDATVTSVSATQISVLTPAHPTGTVDVVVTNADTQSVTSSNAYTYNTTANEGWVSMSTVGVPTTRVLYLEEKIWTGSSMIIWGASKNTGASYDPTTDSWTTLATVNYPLAYDHVGLWTGSKMLVWGGASGATLFNTGLKFDPVSNTWATITTVGAPTPRTRVVSVWTGSNMLVWGGVNGGYYNDGGSYNEESDTWTTITTTGAPSGRNPAAWTWTGSKLILWSGYDGVYVSSGGVYDPSNDSWHATSTTNAPVQRWYHPVTCWTGSKMLVWGGYGPASYINTGGAYDPETNSWTIMSTTGAPSPRYYVPGTCQGTKLFVWGGGNGVYLNDGGIYDYDTNSWSAITTTGAPSARLSAFAVSTGNKMLVWGGGNATLTNTGGVYTPPSNAAANSWTTMTTTGAPLRRMQQPAIWTGSKMVIWGGAWSPFYNDGGSYDPVTNSWTSLSAVSLVPRYRVSAVWTGSKMIVWGGANDDGYYNDGAVYDLLLNSWTLITTTNAPSQRASHNSAWTGSKMFIWGGGNGAMPIQNNGALYNPNTDTWSPIATTNSPTNTSATREVWTGSKVIILTGAQLAKYDPIANSWTYGSSTNTAVSSTWSAVAWTGSKILYWGGCGSGFGGTVSCPSNVGGIYDVNADTWTKMTTVGAPGPRMRLGGVWTGKHMFVFGGYDNASTFYNSGGLYDPSTNQWTATTTNGAPGIRQWTEYMIWTGKNILIWGGHNGTQINTGGIFTPP